MKTRHVHSHYPVPAADWQPLGRRQAHRRRLLGLLLIVVGSVWLWLRLIGWVGDLRLPIDWVEGTFGMLDRLNTGELALFVPQAACGMLVLYTIRAVR